MKIRKLFTVFTIIILSTLFIFPLNAILGSLQDAIRDSKVVDVLYWATKDTKIIDSLLNKSLVEKVEAAPPNGFYIQTGNFVGNAAPKKITGLGFSPDLVILKPDTTAGSGAIFKTKAMAILNVSYFIATAQTSTGAIQLEQDGFTASTTTSNNANVTTSWIAFGGSDCSATGVFCVGEYTGDGNSTKSITTGFQPDLVWVKRSTAVDGNWRSSSMGTNIAQYFSATAQESTGVLFTTLNSNGFTVGATNNAASGIYYYVAFKNVNGFLNVGSYTGNATDNRNITGVGFTPDFVFLKNANSASSAAFNIINSNGDNSNLFTDTANLVNSIQALQSDGFQVGSDATSNGSGNTIYWASFAGSANMSSGSGTFKAASGSYTGTGQNEVISGLDFVPDLVVIKGNTTQTGVFRTMLMSGNSSAVLDGATANITGAIISMNTDGFSIGTSATVNTASTTYYWEAFGNAWNAEKNSGASDFYIGAYYGNGIDNRDIQRLPFQADLITIKRNSTTAGTFRTSDMAADFSGFFAATAEAANNIQTINSNGFQVGTAANVNSSGSIYFYFGFKEGSNFTVGTYSGTGSAHDITGVGFQPDSLWVKATGATRGVMRNSSGASNSALPFINVASISNALTGLVSDGFTVGTTAETNTSGTNNYRYAAWKNNYTPLSQQSYKVQTGYYVGNGAYKLISGLGFSPELVIIKSDANTTGTIFKTKYMPMSNTAYFIATADSTTGITYLNTDGFTVSSTADTANVRYTWIAFAGSDCSSSGKFCTRSFIGNGTSPRAISDVGFQPDLAVVKRSTAVDGNWRSSSMGSNIGQYFSATVQDSTGTFFASLDSTGFTVGTTNNAAAGIYYYFAFKNSTGTFNVGTYSGNATDNRNITGIGFQPNYLLLKNASSAVSAISNQDESYGDSSSLFTATANLVNSVQALQSDGFQVGSDSSSNGSGNTIYWVAFAGSITHSSSGTFEMATGTYTGAGNYQVINGLTFVPDLIIIKGNTTQAGVFRSRSMGGDSTAYLDSATANLAGAIIALNYDGFTVGASATVNSASVTYYWTAYGNAWETDNNSGGSDFFIGGYYGNGIDNRSVSRLPFQADMITVKRSGATAGTFRTSDMAGDLSGFFAATAESANNIQAIQSDGFQVGTAANVNTAANLYFYFGFKAGSNFSVGKYSGTGSAHNVTGIGFQPDNLWIKATGATRGVERTKDSPTDSALPFINVASLSSAITGLISDGFSVGTASETNTSGTNNYRYVAWRIAPVGSLYVDIVDSGGSSVASPSITFNTIDTTFTCQSTNATFGTSSQKIRVTNSSGNPSWTLTLAANSGNTSLWNSGSDNYDYNDSSGTPAGCSDGVDADSYAGEISIDFSSATITPAAGCTNTGISFGSNASYIQGSIDSIVLVQASSGAQTGCYWDVTGISIAQKIPQDQASGTYNLNMSLSTVAN